jgi:hypothetical protein
MSSNASRTGGWPGRAWSATALIASLPRLAVRHRATNSATRNRSVYPSASPPAGVSGSAQFGWWTFGILPAWQPSMSMTNAERSAGDQKAFEYDQSE